MARTVKVVMLGTSGGVPTLRRRLPAILIQDWMGTTILLDAGEGVQESLLRLGLPPTRIDFIAITHSHGDHVNGLPGLLQSMYMYERRRPLLIMGPSSVVEFVRGVLGVLEYNLGFRVALRAIEGEGSLTLVERGGDKVVISWAPACHSVESYGFRLDWLLRPRIDARLAKELLGDNMALLRELIARGRVTLDDGRVVRISDIAREPGRNLGIAYTGDTAEPCKSLDRILRGVRLLIHDSTFTSDKSDEALERGHSTSLMAAKAAAEAGAHLLVLTHVSARYEGGEARRMVEEARRVFPNVLLAWDGLTLLFAV